MSSSSTTTVDPWQEKLDRLRKRKPAEAYVVIHDDAAMAAVTQAQADLAQARMQVRSELVGKTAGVDVDELLAADPRVKKALKAVDAAAKAQKEAEVVFRFRALPPDVYDNLRTQHPPTEEQEAAGQDKNPDTWVPAIVSACSIDPITPEQVRGLIDDGVLNTGEVVSLINACREVNERPLTTAGKGSPPTLD